MTETEWLTATEPKPMIDFLGLSLKRAFIEVCSVIGVYRQKQCKIERKFRLFACACMRHVWDRLDEPARMATEVAERQADDEAMFSEAIAAARRRRYRKPLVNEPSFTGACDSAHHCSRLAARLFVAENLNDTRRLVVAQHLATLMRDIFGNPFRPVTLNPSWLTSTVLALATGIYDEKAFDRMPILADALQDADCDNEDILNHCRQPGEHVRGCWVVDLVLDRG
jgi:hypothetical protein